MLGIDCEGRYTHSNQIDWAPVMPTVDHISPFKPNLIGPRSTFGFGISKSVYLVPLQYKAAAIVSLVPHTFYAGGHPTQALTDETHAGFEVGAPRGGDTGW